MKYLYLIILNLLVFITLSGQTKYVISGYVYDKSNNEVLIGATVYEPNLKIGSTTNEYGFYSLRFESELEPKLIVSYIGYKSQILEFNDSTSISKNFYLESGINLDLVEITDNNVNSTPHNNEISTVEIKMEEIKNMPNLFGEVDLVKTLQLTPGVQSGGEAKSDLFVRGGSPDQNLVLLDGVPLYYIAHFAGFFSIFNSDAINNVKFVKGGFPARYGSRLSSVLDIQMKNGNMKEMKVSGTFGLISSKILIEGPIIKNKMSYIFSARKKIFPIFKLFDSPIKYDFYDINAKWNYIISDKDRIYFNIYLGDDVVKDGFSNEITQAKKTLKWGNKLFAFKWNHLYSNKLFSNLNISSTTYRNIDTYNHSVEYDSINEKTYSELLSGIQDLNLDLSFKYNLGSKYNLNFGVQSIYHNFKPANRKYKFTKNENVIADNISNSQLYAFENSIFLENEIKFKNFNSNIGIRASQFSVQDKNYKSLEPRILLTYVFAKNFSVKYSYSIMNQYIHLLTYSGVGMPNDYWMPSNKNIIPENSSQHSFGLFKSFKNQTYNFSIESYYKELNNLITFKSGHSLTKSVENWDNIVEKNGYGLNYGLEFYAKKTKGKATGWISITLSKAKRKFNNINNGEYYPFKYDRLLDISLVYIQEISKSLNFSIVWKYGSGYPITLAKSYYTVNETDVLVYFDKNSNNMRDFHRLDCAVNYTRNTDWGKSIWSFSIYNVYNRQNPYYYYYKRDFVSTTIGTSFGGANSGEFRLYQRSLFSIFPSFSYSFEF